MEREGRPEEAYEVLDAHTTYPEDFEDVHCKCWVVRHHDMFLSQVVFKLNGDFPFYCSWCFLDRPEQPHCEHVQAVRTKHPFHVEPAVIDTSPAKVRELADTLIKVNAGIISKLDNYLYRHYRTVMYNHGTGFEPAVKVDVMSPETKKLLKLEEPNWERMIDTLIIRHNRRNSMSNLSEAKHLYEQWIGCLKNVLEKTNEHTAICIQEAKDREEEEAIKYLKIDKEEEKLPEEPLQDIREKWSHYMSDYGDEITDEVN